MWWYLLLFFSILISSDIRIFCSIILWAQRNLWFTRIWFKDFFCVIMVRFKNIIIPPKITVRLNLNTSIATFKILNTEPIWIDKCYLFVKRKRCSTFTVAVDSYYLIITRLFYNKTVKNTIVYLSGSQGADKMFWQPWAFQKH